MAMTAMMSMNVRTRRFLTSTVPRQQSVLIHQASIPVFSVAAIGKSGALSRSKGKYIYSNEVHSNLCLAALQIMIIAVKLRMM